MNARLSKAGTSMVVTLVLLLGVSVVPSSVHAQEGTTHPDARPLPPHIQELKAESVTAAGAGTTDAPGYYDTSVFMTGSVVVGIVLPESTGSGENWTTTEKNTVVQEIQSGMTWWVTKGGTLANLSFQFDVQNVSTTYEPITLGTSSEGLWIGQSMANLGYSSGDYFERVYAYNNHIRDQYNTDWAFTIFVVDSSADVDGKFSDGYFGYAYLSGPFIVMTYDNNGWGISNMDLVTSHETGHIFLAGDQYYAPSYGGCSSLTQRFGYLGVANSNCQYNNPSSVPSIMRNNENAVDTTARGQLGWRDSDVDGKPDPMDTLPLITLSQHTPDPTAETSWSYSGNVEIPPYTHTSCVSGDACYYRDVTTQTITQIQYRIDSGTWASATASDGSLNSDIENFTFSVSGMTPGTHSIQVQATGSSGNVSAWSDSVTVNGPISAGRYDDRHGAWAYSGSWQQFNGSGPYSNTLSYSGTVNNLATFMFEGSRFTLMYTQYPNRGLMDVYVDNVKVASLNQNGATTWQKTWNSGTFTPGIHIVKLIHFSGAIVDVDAIQIFAQSDLVAPGTISDLVGSSGTGNGTVNLNWTAVGDDGNTGTASSYLVRYSTSVITNESAWTNAMPVTSGVPTPKAAGQPESMTVSGLVPGQTYFFAVRALDEELNTGGLSNSPSAAAKSPAPLGVGKYDDASANWVYSGAWITYMGSGPSSNTLHYTNSTTATANFVFTGARFTLLFSKYSNRGSFEIWLDGTTLVTTINANSTALLWQQSYASPTFADGTHTVTIKNISTNGNYIDVDAVEIFGPPVPVGPGTYDDTHAAWMFSGTWLTYAGSGPHASTLHYTNVQNASASITFTGTQFTVWFARHSNRGNMEVWIDGTLAYTFSQNGGALTWQQSWTLPTLLSYGTHTVEFRNPSATSGVYVDIDAITITGPVGAGTYDDNHAAWTYGGNWTTYAGNGPYTSTLHYSNAQNSSASMTFTGTQFTVWFARHPNRGNVEVWIDGVLAHTFSQNGGVLAWQQGWTLPTPLSDGTHTVVFKNPNSSAGTYVDIDAITILNPVGPGIYDDANIAWTYAGSWITYTGSGPYANTLHYTDTVNSVATFVFQAPARFVLSYTAASNRGDFEVHVDGVLLTTINAYSPGLLWQMTYSSPMYTDNGAHIVQIKNIGTGRADVDAIQILDTASSTGPTIAGCPIFPSNNIWNVRVDILPVHSLSTQWINSIGRATGFHMDFGSGTWDGGPIGIPYNITSNSTPKYALTFYYPGESEAGPYPIPANALIEYGSDHHLLAMDSSTCTLYEVYDITQNANGTWSGGSGAIWNLNSNALRPAGWTSADAAGLPILPGLVRYEEVQAGAINHALRFTASSTNRYIWPARHLTSDTSDTSIPPMGARFRLKAGYDISGFSQEMQVILRAMKTYGIILADNGSDWYVSGAPNESWDNDMLHLLDVLTGDDFEAVDASSLMVNVDSGSTR